MPRLLHWVACASLAKLGQAARTAQTWPASPLSHYNQTLFVAGFDPRSIRTRDLEELFERVGKLRVSYCWQSGEEARAGGLWVWKGRLGHMDEHAALSQDSLSKATSQMICPTCSPRPAPQRCEIKKTFAFIEYYDLEDAKVGVQCGALPAAAEPQQRPCPSACSLVPGGMQQAARRARPGPRDHR